MPRVCRLIGRLSAGYRSDTRVACHATSTRSCICATCIASALTDGSTSYHIVGDASVCVSLDGDVCTGARSCTCSGCRAETSGAALSQSTASYPSAAKHSGLQRPSIAQSIGLGRQELLSSRARASYSSLASSRRWNLDINQLRGFSSIDDYQSQLDAINDAFVEARDEIEYAQEDSETVYFEEGLKTAQEAVADALGKYNALLDSLDDGERGKLQRSMGMKMEQLKAELHTVEQTHA